MVKTRLIATLLLNNRDIVQTRKFKRTNMVGNAFTAVDFFNAWAVDEIMLLEISHDRSHIEATIEIVEELSRRCVVPLTVGGKIAERGLADRYVRAGADKVVVNTHAARAPDLIGQIASHFGRQCCVVSIDARPDPSRPSGYRVVIDNGREDTDLDVVEWAVEAVRLGAGEIMVNSVERDGDKGGYDIDLLRAVSAVIEAPLIAMGGVGCWQHLVDGVVQGGADAVAAGNIFHYSEHSTKKAKEFMVGAGLHVRAPSFFTVDMPRMRKYRPF